MARLILLIVLSLSVIVTVTCDEQDLDKDDPLNFMYCLFVQKGCDETKIALLQAQVAAYIATMDDKEASKLGGVSAGKPLTEKNTHLKTADTITKAAKLSE